jgi:hypothetical protein
MDLTQRKLTKAEWDSIEVPLSYDEQHIIELIKDGFNDVQIKRNYTLSLLRHLKITFTAAIDMYVYTTYLHPQLLRICTKYNKELLTKAEASTATVTLKKADIIRFSNTQKQINEHKESLFEFVIIELIEKMLKAKTAKLSTTTKSASNNLSSSSSSSSSSWLFHYYTLRIIIQYNVELFNTQLRRFVNDVLAWYEPEVDISALLAMSYDIIERNDYLLKYADETLYDHQKQLFTLCKRPAPKLLLYIAPTGTGKTLSPIGLANSVVAAPNGASGGNYRIIFVCAARHVGLSLAKSAISAHKRVAFAFGCQSAEDIRLHYYAAKEYTKNKKSGGIGKVDNSVGDNVEIMICDIQSYLPAMYYMLAFNKKEHLIMYWDEPTITLDKFNAADKGGGDVADPNPLHATISANWAKNLIPNIVLSSATLPRREEISEVICSFRTRFSQENQEAEIHEIVSYDCKKTIPLLNKEGFIEMPHYLAADWLEMTAIIEHTKKYKTLLRYFDLSEAVRFIMYLNENGYIKKTRYQLKHYFPSADCITMLNIKNYYLELLGLVVSSSKDDWTRIYNYFITTRRQNQKSTVHIVTQDAHTLTDGPAIFLAEDVDKIAKFYIQSAAIPDRVLKEIMAAITFNSSINAKRAVMEKDFEDGTNKDAEKEKKMSDAERLSPDMKRLMQKIEAMKEQIKTVMLDSVFVPNTKDHLYKFADKLPAGGNGYLKNKPFTCDISEYNVEQIMLIDDIADYWKLLLLMGIGVFSSTHKSDRYTEIMKRLAQEQKLFMLIASSDYIYGTNYQFCHGYIGKDLEEMSQEKCIQAMGRIGRNKLQHEYSIRFRENALIRRLFMNDEDKPEVKNMNKLFC